MRDIPPLDSLFLLLQVARSGSLTAAGNELGMTHGALSRRINTVEEWLGRRVFERHGRGVRLTAEGALIVRRMERLAAALIDTANAIRAPQASTIVRISVLPSFARLWLIPRLALVERADPHVTIELSLEHEVARLDRRSCDLAIRTGYGDWSGVNAQRLFGERLYPIGSPSLAERIGSDARLLFSEPILHDGDASDWKRWSASAGLDYAPRGGERRFPEYDLVLNAARAGLGVALARVPLASGALGDGGLVPTGHAAVDVGRAHWIVSQIGDDREPVRAVSERILALARGCDCAAASVS